jgi:hypothetical protein
VEDVNWRPPQPYGPNAQFPKAVEGCRNRAQLQPPGLNELLERESAIGKRFIDEHTHEVVTLRRPQAAQQAIYVATDAVELVLQEATIDAYPHRASITHGGSVID